MPTTRRQLLAGAAASPLLWPRASRAFADEPAGAAFYQRWPYVVPADILPYLRAHAAQGDASAVLSALEAFSTHYPMYTLGAEKGALLESLVAAAKPRTALEVGTFFGYSAVRTARSLPPGGRLLCVEASAANADVARAVLALAGLDSVATVLTGLAAKALPEAAQRLGPGGADFIFIDHCKECYLPDTKQMESLGLLPPGATLVADNVLVPGAPDFLVRAPPRLLRHPARLALSCESPSAGVCCDGCWALRDAAAGRAVRVHSDVAQGRGGCRAAARRAVRLAQAAATARRCRMKTGRRADSAR